MPTPNHIVGGLVITGLFGSFMNLNILASPWYIATTIVASLLPDIDHSRSIIGKVFLPLSRFLNRRYGHRTITHSLLALLGLSLLIAYLETTFLHSSIYSKIFFLAYFSHLVLDMMTVQGVPLLYPFLKNPCVMPGNPDLRFKTGNWQTETMIFSFFLLSAIFLQPLIKKGFWTQYNRFFGTPKHLASEFRKSDDALLVKYLVKKGTEQIRGEGICVEVSDNTIVLLEEDGFHQLDKTAYAILEVIPEHTGQALHFETIYFVDISVDSLNQLVHHSAIQKIDLHGNQPFVVHHQNREERKRQFRMEYPQELWFEEVESAIPSMSFVPLLNPKIKTLRQQILFLRMQNQQSITDFQKVQEELALLMAHYSESIDLVKKERLLSRIKILQKIKAPLIDTSKIEMLQFKIEELELADQLKNQEKQLAIQEEYVASLTSATRLTGMITTVVILNPTIQTQK